MIRSTFQSTLRRSFATQCAAPPVATPQTFLVTGGASGLGEAVVRRLTETGRNVIVCDVDEQRGTALAQELGAAARFVKTDVSSESDVQEAVATAVREYGGVNGAVSCAGIAVATKVLSKKGVHALDSFNRVVNVNLGGTFNVMRLVAEQMSKQEATGPDAARGVLVQTASIAAFDGQVGQAAYAASKGGVVGMTLPIARELSKLGIRVVTVAPGLFNTPLLAALPEKARLALGASVPFPPRLGEPSEFAKLVEQIIDNPMINGEVIRIDGSLRMQ
eukprot:TRINITY_DN6170_c0_g1_i1.p1 TRINITY_DN6170_c0_g1~~TRINITY_DN6170_c0_g1_i1.p1  ORF type:complete len:276 (-),score=97.37 TRINITY_DN6170_c0_g1_i1:24-851(-)